MSAGRQLRSADAQGLSAPRCVESSGGGEGERGADSRSPYRDREFQISFTYVPSFGCVVCKYYSKYNYIVRRVFTQASNICE